MAFDGIDHDLHRRVRDLEQTTGELMAAIDDITTAFEALKAATTETISALQAQVVTLAGNAEDPTKVAALEADIGSFTATVASANPTPLAPSAPAVPAQTA